MTGTTLTIVVSPAERTELARTAEREKVNVSDYVRMRLGLRALGEEAEEPADAGVDGRLADHERRITALERP